MEGSRCTCVNRRRRDITSQLLHSMNTYSKHVCTMLNMDYNRSFISTMEPADLLACHEQSPSSPMSHSRHIVRFSIPKHYSKHQYSNWALRDNLKRNLFQKYNFQDKFIAYYTHLMDTGMHWLSYLRTKRNWGKGGMWN